MCFHHPRVLICVRFEKIYWDRGAAYTYIGNNIADVALFLHPTFHSRYHEFIYYDEHRCKDIHSVEDRLRHITYIYGRP
jgi:hypothetical protein